MWVPKEVVPRLQEGVEELLREQLAMDDLPDPDPGSRWDPNDLIIFHDFVLIRKGRGR